MGDVVKQGGNMLWVHAIQIHDVDDRPRRTTPPQGEVDTVRPESTNYSPRIASCANACERS
ncbi:hypothetical protein PJM56_30045, partial [Mycobacterium kansasii]